MVDEHNHNIVMMLQGKLATTSMTFKDVLELRTQVHHTLCSTYSAACSISVQRRQNMKESKNRTEQFMYTAQSSANQAPSSVYLLLCFRF